MMATGLGSFVEGAVKGYSTVQEMQRREALQKRDDERYAMERERFAMEKTRAERLAEQERLSDEAKKKALQVMDDQKFGRGAFAKLADPAKIQAVQQAAQSVEEKGARSYDQKEMQRLGVRPPAEAQTNSVTPEEENMFKSGGEGLYPDQRASENLKYQLIGEAMKESLIAKGEFGQAMLVDRDIKKMIDEGYDLQRKKALAFIIAGAPPSTVIPALRKVYGFIDDGKDIDIDKSTYDPKTRSYSLAFVDQKTGQTDSRTLNQMQLATGLNLADPLKVIEANIGSDRRAEDIQREDKRFADTQKMEQKKLDVSMSVANAQIARYKSLTNAEQTAAKGSEQKAKVEAMIKMFPVPDLSMEKIGMLSKEEQEQKKQEAVRNMDLFEKTSQLSGLNPKVDIQTLANAARLVANGTLQAFKDKDGTYTKIGNTRVALP
jgi:uncharacterized protein YaiL (DUF2058 family)